MNWHERLRRKLVFSVYNYVHPVRKKYQLDDAIASEADSMAVVLPQLRQARPSDLVAIRAEYQDEYEHYVQSISAPNHAISLQQVGLLAWCLRTVKPKSVLDTGSGFSTYVLAREFGETWIEHYSFDDHPEWLQKTRDYLRSKQLPDTNVRLWNKENPGSEFDGKFEFIYHDLGSLTTRVLSLPRVLKCLAPGGLLILDDMHHQHLNLNALQLMKDANLVWTTLIKHTFDQYGRYAYAARSAHCTA